MDWIEASATSGECPRAIDQSSFGRSLVVLHQAVSQRSELIDQPAVVRPGQK